MATPNFGHYFERGENARKRGEPREIPPDIKSLGVFSGSAASAFLKGWDFRNAVLGGWDYETNKPSSYP